MNRFTLQRLFASVTLIAIGLAAILFVLRNLGNLDGERSIGLWLAILWFGGGALLGAGLFAPFEETLYGVIFVLAIQLVCAAAVVFRAMSGLGGV